MTQHKRSLFLNCEKCCPWSGGTLLSNFQGPKLLEMQWNHVTPARWPQTSSPSGQLRKREGGMPWASHGSEHVSAHIGLQVTQPQIPREVWKHMCPGQVCEYLLRSQPTPPFWSANTDLTFLCVPKIYSTTSLLGKQPQIQCAWLNHYIEPSVQGGLLGLSTLPHH